MEFKDYYQVLGVARDASEAEIKKAWRRLARQHHPDVSKAADASARMQEINEAWDVLKDPAKRAAYDRLGQHWQGGQEFQPPPGWDAGFEFSGGPGEGFGADFGAADHSAFFEALFGNLRGRGAPRGAHRGAAGGADFRARGQDHHAKIVVPLEDAFTGASRTITLSSPGLDAHGNVVLHERTLAVTLPRGLHAGQQIRLAGQGAPGSGGAAAGDLYLEVQFEPHRRYRVDGRDLYVTLPVAPWEAVLGAAVPVQTPEGRVELSVPAGSQGGRKLRLRGRGIPAPAAQGGAGDLYAVLEIVLPPAADDAARAAWRRLAGELAFDPRQGREG